MDKKNIKKNKKTNKKNNDIFSVRNIIIACITILLVFTMLLIILLFPNSKKNSNNSDDGANFKGSSEVLTKVEEIGRNFYEKVYYQDLEDKEFILSNIALNGLNISLRDIKLLYSFGDEVDKLLAKNNCDLDLSKILFSPKDPYKEKDYDIDVKLYCEN